MAMPGAFTERRLVEATGTEPVRTQRLSVELPLRSSHRSVSGWDSKGLSPRRPARRKRLVEPPVWNRKAGLSLWPACMLVVSSRRGAGSPPRWRRTGTETSGISGTSGLSRLSPGQPLLQPADEYQSWPDHQPLEPQPLPDQLDQLQLDQACPFLSMGSAPKKKVAFHDGVQWCLL